MQADAPGSTPVPQPADGAAGILPDSEYVIARVSRTRPAGDGYLLPGMFAGGVRIRPEDECEHGVTVCPGCAGIWEQEDWTFCFDQTPGGIRLRKAIEQQDAPAGDPEGSLSPQPAHAQHLCLYCGCRIGKGEMEVRVRLTRGGMRGQVRYRHAEDSQCQAALRVAQPAVARIGPYAQSPAPAWPGRRKPHRI